jgi:hypothetical protein
MVQLLLSCKVIQDEQRQAAIYKRDLKGLYLKVRNFNAMCQILNCMGYSLPFRLTGSPTIEFSNTTVKASKVLQYFGWAPTLFDHKSGWYGVAEILSQHNWKGNPPGK